MNSREVIREFNHCLSGSMTVEGLKVWVFSNLQEALDTGDETTVRWMNEANVLLMELTDGLIEAEKFVRSLDAIVRESETLSTQWYPNAGPVFEFGILDSVTIKQKAAFNRQVSDLPLQPFDFGL